VGIFKKVKDGIDSAAQAQQFAQQNATQQAGDGQVGVEGNLPVDPAALGGPSSQPLAADDPMLQPVNGIGIPEYAAVAKEAQARGVTDEAGMNQIAAEMGHDPAVFGPAVQEWVSRMGKSMVVGQAFRKEMGY
jgi:hypothetical protein